MLSDKVSVSKVLEEQSHICMYICMYELYVSMVGSLCIVMRFIMRNRPCGFEAEQSLPLSADWRPRKSGGSAVCKRLRPQEAFGANCDTRAEGDGVSSALRGTNSLFLVLLVYSGALCVG